MNRIAFLLCFVLLTSCNYFEKKKIYSEDLLEEELETFNWADVDDYPSFSSCDSLETKDQRKSCFQNTLLQQVNSQLAQHLIVVSQDVSDTIEIKILISKDGDLKIQDIIMNDLTREAIPHIDSILTRSLSGLPKIYPALKRGQQVRSVFKLPVIVAIN